uniref:Akirin n=1 Tax=Clastoptera arizonana TaxID=38151 RepID=A0A1B6DP15_9HEMI
MACATLKRSLDFDPVHSHGRPSKRQRCVPMCVSPSSSPPTTRNDNPSPFSDICSKLTPEIMAAEIREEMRRLHRRKQLHFNPNDNHSNDRESSSDSPGSPSSHNFASIFAHSHRDKPLFTFRQVGMICERILTERESQLREEYDRILSIKLSEQYDAFVKFSNDQLQRLRPSFEVGGGPSYLS